MRVASVLAWLICALAINGHQAAVAADNQVFPYTAFIDSDDIYVRCGPGKKYYATEKLVRGDQVEVHRHDPGGWYAVRPPRGSFSWVALRDVKQVQDDLGVVQTDRAVCYVGSRLDATHDCVQVRMEKGEEVEILGHERLSDAPNAGEYYKIAPPSGEFRWIYGKYLRRSLPDEVVSSSKRDKVSLANGEEDIADPNGPIQTAPASRSRRAAADRVVDDRAATDPLVTPAPPRRTLRMPRRPLPDDSIAIEEPEEQLSTVAAAQRRVSPGFRTTAKRDARRAGDDYADAPPTRDAAQGDRNNSGIVTNNVAGGDNVAQLDALQRDLAAVEVELSGIVAQDTSTWQFADVRSQAEGLLARSETALERGRIRLLLNRISRFEDIKMRSETLSRITTDTDRRNAQIPITAMDVRATSPTTTAAFGRVMAPLAGSVPATPQFDAAGKLTPVVSQKPGAPRYALVSPAREVVSFVTPAPGVNLQPYVGQQVGITGQRGYATDLKRPHITAARVMPLDASSTTTIR